MAEWHLSGDYFENCNCSVMCPCFVSKAPPLTSRPTEGVCDVALIFHIENGAYDNVVLDGLNVALVVHTPGPMGEGNWSLGAYIDQRADDKQTDALGAIFTGAAGGPIAQLAPLVGKNLGVRKVSANAVGNFAIGRLALPRNFRATGLLHAQMSFRRPLIVWPRQSRPFVRFCNMKINSCSQFEAIVLSARAGTAIS